MSLHTAPGKPSWADGKFREVKGSGLRTFPVGQCTPGCVPSGYQEGTPRMLLRGVQAPPRGRERCSQSPPSINVPRSRGRAGCRAPSADRSSGDRPWVQAHILQARYQAAHGSHLAVAATSQRAGLASQPREVRECVGPDPSSESPSNPSSAYPFHKCDEHFAVQTPPPTCSPGTQPAHTEPSGHSTS